MADFGGIKFSSFFDRPAVMKKVRDGTKSALSRAGAFVRTRMRTSIRKRKKSSTPGSPPSSHTGLLRDRIFFAYDDRSQSVVIGPQLLNGHSRGSVPIPELLDQGGDTKTAKGERAHYDAFPFVRPALDAERSNFPGLFRDSVK